MLGEMGSDTRLDPPAESGSQPDLALANHFLDIARPQETLRVLDELGGDAFGDPDYWALRAEAKRRLEDESEAVESARRGLELDPQNAGLLDVMALAEVARGNVKVALEAIETAIEVRPEDPTLHAHRALILLAVGNVADARSAANHAIRLAPENRAALRTRARIAVETRDERAEEYITALLAVAPEDATGHALRGDLALGRKKFGAASEAFTVAAQLRPDHDPIRKAARESRIYMHPLMAPARLISRFGRWRTILVVWLVSGMLAAIGAGTLRVILAVAWLVIMLGSAVALRVLRRRERRRFGGH